MQAGEIISSKLAGFMCGAIMGVFIGRMIFLLVNAKVSTTDVTDIEQRNRDEY
jgi:hypothetical protein